MKFLARDGYVYGFNADFPTLNKTNGMPDVRRIGISNASTFTGFCGFHDNQTFEPIEKYPFQSNQQHTFLLGYRAICKEVFQKKAEMELLSFRRSLDRGKSIEGQIRFQQFVDDWETGLTSGLNDVEHYKAIYDKSLLSDDFSEVRYCVFRLRATPDFLCSGAAYAESDFEGNSLQEFQDPDTLLEPIAFSIIATDTGGAVVFSWLGNSCVNSKLIRSIDSLSEDQIPHAIARFTFEYFENVFMAPDWWESLSESAKDAIFRRVATGAHPNLLRTDACLIDDGLRIVNWSVDSRESSLAEDSDERTKNDE